MMAEIGLQVPDEDENPWIDGGVTFLHCFLWYNTIVDTFVFMLQAIH